MPYEPNPHAPALEVLPEPLPELVRRCFEDGHTEPTARPSAADWHEALRVAEKGLQPCSVNRQHIFNKAMLFCPWCELAARQGRDPFPSPEDVREGNVGILMAIPLPEEKPAPGIMTVIPLDEPPSYARLPHEPSPVLQVLFSPLWLVVFAIVGLIILFVAIMQSRSPRKSESPPAPHFPPSFSIVGSGCHR